MGRTDSESSSGVDIDEGDILDNLEKYRRPDETEREWQLKKLFIEKYHGQFTEGRLICLAQCYSNIESYGCTYPHQVMEQVKELTRDLGVELTGTYQKPKKVFKSGAEKRKRKRLLKRVTFKKFTKTYTKEQFTEIFDEYIETVNPFESFEFILNGFAQYTNKQAQ